MTATTQPPAGAESNEDPATAGGGITRLNATDGLFLRAEHLTAMQDYARDLTYAAGLANGTGVVYGFTVTLSKEPGDTLPEKPGDKLEVSPGLAIDPIGRPLRSQRTALVSLPDGPGESNWFWVLEVIPAQWTYGTDKAFGNLCDDPCNGSTITPWQAEGLTVHLQQYSMSGLECQCLDDRRSWLASQYFERERQRGDPWLTPSEVGGKVNPINRCNWSEGIPQPSAAGVPIALLQRVGDDWVIDVWGARREVGDPPARRTWQWRLGMRPWNVFLAQVLQFQAQLADVSPARVQGDKADPADVIANVCKVVQEMTVKPRALLTAVDELQNFASTPIAAVGGRSLRDQGFVELPPAGFLRMTGEVSSAIKEFFGENVDVRICHCRADYIPNVIEQAQHLDRIPLDGSPEVDVLVPTDFSPATGISYGWVAFVRRSKCKPPVDEVDVYLMNYDAGNDDQLYGAAKNLEETLEDATQSLGVSLGTLKYPVDTWAYPGGKSLIDDIFPEGGSKIIVIGALTNDDDRLPLAALRASLFAACFDRNLVPPPVQATVNMESAREAIIVVKYKGASELGSGGELE